MYKGTYVDVPVRTVLLVLFYQRGTTTSLSHYERASYVVRVLIRRNALSPNYPMVYADDTAASVLGVRLVEVPY